MNPLHVLAIVKGVERFIFIYQEGQEEVLLETLGGYATDKDLDFDWYDATVLSQKIKRIQRARSEDYGPDF